MPANTLGLNDLSPSPQNNKQCHMCLKNKQQTHTHTHTPLQIWHNKILNFEQWYFLVYFGKNAILWKALWWKPHILMENYTGCPRKKCAKKNSGKPLKDHAGHKSLCNQHPRTCKPICLFKPGTVLPHKVKTQYLHFR